MKVSVLLLEGVLVMEEDVAVQILKASGLAETQELEVNETILNGVSFATPSKWGTRWEKNFWLLWVGPLGPG